MNIIERDYDQDIITLAEAIDLSPDISNVIATTRAVVPGLKTSADLVPFDEDSGRPDLYRAELYEKAPRVARLACDILRHFESGTMAAVVPSLGLEGQPLEVQRYILFALGNLLGTPTATEPRERRVLWDVKVRTATSGQFATFSETDDEAEFHSDSAFQPDPEPIFFLYVVQAARCGGGMSYFANGRRVRDRLMRTSRGRDAFHLLSRARLPFRIPPAFSQDPNVAEYSAGTVFGERPLIRFRRDVILRALDANPVPGNDEIRDAVNLVADAAFSLKTTDRKLPTGGIAFVDNHSALHGRSSFSDAERHLVRVRVAGRSSAAGNVPAAVQARR
jgi:hypothetical protein